MKRVWVAVAVAAAVCWAAVLVTAPSVPSAPPMATDGPNQVVVRVPGMT